jgi:hypothetical protein
MNTVIHVNSYQILIKLEFCRPIFEKQIVLNFVNIRPVRIDLLHEEG